MKTLAAFIAPFVLASSLWACDFNATAVCGQQVFSTGCANQVFSANCGSGVQFVPQRVFVQRPQRVFVQRPRRVFVRQGFQQQPIIIQNIQRRRGFNLGFGAFSGFGGFNPFFGGFRQRGFGFSLGF